MRKRFTLGTVLSLMLPVAVLSAIIAYSIAVQKFNDESEELNQRQQMFSKYKEARDILQKNFVEPVDDGELQDGAVRGMVASLGDRYSHYLTAEEYEEYRNTSANQFEGIGVTVSMSDQGDILIAEVYDGSPAMESGVERLDRIVAVEGRPVSETGYELAVSVLSGEENTKVSFTLRKASDGSQAELTLVRRRIDVRAVSSEILAGQNIGLVRVRNFDLNVDRDFRDVLVRLQNAGVDGIIFDMRNNPGGQLDVMCSMLSMLLPKGELLITLRDKNGRPEQRASEGPGEIGLPAAVLINAYSHSAAEFFAAALRAYDKAILVGQPTTGKGYAQKPIRLADGSAIILSISEYMTPKGRSLSGVGLTPDHIVELTPEADKNFYSLSHEQDAQLQKAIEVLVGVGIRD